MTMQALRRGKHFITLRDWTQDEVETLLAVSVELKAENRLHTAKAVMLLTMRGRGR